MGSLPRPVARRLGGGITTAFYYLHRRLIRVGRRNLELALPELAQAERERILRELYQHLGRQMAEFCLFPRDRREDLAALMPTVGLEHYLEAQARGKGVLVLTAHLGAWELASFGHSLAGYPMRFIIRPLDNRPLDALVNRYRGLHGNLPISKRDFARGLLQAMQANQTVGVLLDQNSSPPQGVFVPFFGVPACTAAGPAKIALRTGAAVVPGFAVWEKDQQRYVLYFEPAIELPVSGDEDADVVAHTAIFNAVLERWIRRYPEQWLWIHRRWKTRPPGQTALY
ncbi:MAG: lipid A biosynthesis acyltransferase [Acidobacteria bacterium]|nr:MAG: lipid A biosynthesis acyltransferase [Acidobacteriota bacterium]